MKLSALIRVTGTILTAAFAAFGVLLVTVVLLARTDDNGVTRVAGRPVLTVLSDSMTPTFKAGDILVEAPAAQRAAELPVGTVVTFHAGNGLVTHRIVGVEGADGSVAYRTQGDANNMVDATLVQPEQIVGTYSWRIPSAGYVLDAAQTPTGLTIVILVPALLLLIPRFVTWWRAAGDEADRKNSDPALDPAGVGRANT